MSKDSITQLHDPSGFAADPITDLIRDGARKLLQQAVEAELEALLAGHADERTSDGRARLVRHGHLPERDVLTGVGPVPVKVPRVRDRGDGDDRVECDQLESKIRPRLADFRRTLAQPDRIPL